MTFRNDPREVFCCAGRLRPSPLPRVAAGSSEPGGGRAACFWVGARGSELSVTPARSLFLLQVSLPGGPRPTATAAARTAKATRRERAARHATSCQRRAATVSRRPALPRRPSSAAPSPASPTYRLWTGRPRRGRCSCCSSPRSGGRATCSGLSPPAPESPTPARKKR